MRRYQSLMRKITALLILLSSCKSDHSSESGTQPITQPEEWWTYEGVVRSDSGNDIMIELSLLQGAVGVPSLFRTREEFVSFEDKLMLSGRGEYTVRLGASDVGNIVEIRSKKTRVYAVEGPGLTNDKSEYSKKLFEEARISELIFKTGEFGDLVLVDRNHTPLASDDRYTLKRRSRLYDVEGFITLGPDTSGFYEVNSNRTWNVSKSGAYGEAYMRYHALADEHHQGVYLKGVAFLVRTRNRHGNEVESMVIKRITSMKSHEQLME